MTFFLKATKLWNNLSKYAKCLHMQTNNCRPLKLAHFYFYGNAPSAITLLCMLRVHHNLTILRRENYQLCPFGPIKSELHVFWMPCIELFVV